VPLDLRISLDRFNICLALGLEASLKKNRSIICVGAAAILWSIWKTRNNACFRSIRPNDPIAVINMIFHLMSSWAIFQVKETNCDALILGAKLFLRLSSEAFQASKGWRPVVRRITDDIEDPGIK
jgi:hypothetical protein